jgi:hypothetical protein
VAVAENELHSVAAYVLGLRHGYIFRNRPGVEHARAGQFVNATRAAALRAQELYGIDRNVVVVPSDGDLARSGLLYLYWHGYWHKRFGADSSSQSSLYFPGAALSITAPVSVKYYAKRVAHF